MQKKFKEYRMFIVCLILFVVFSIVTIMSFIQKKMPQAIGALMLTGISLLLLVGRYKMVLFDDVMMIYEWKFFAMLPTAVEYKDVKSLVKKSKHHLVLTHQRVSHIYVMDADQFIEDYESLKKGQN